MSQLYNLYQGSLLELREQLEAAAVDPDEKPEALQDLVTDTWQLVDPLIAEVLDWHDESALLAEAQSAGLNYLVKKLFGSPVLEVDSDGFGCVGSLEAGELAQLRVLLESALSSQADSFKLNESEWELRLEERRGNRPGLVALLVGLRPADLSKDIILLL